MSQAKIQGNLMTRTVEDVTDVFHDLAHIYMPTGCTPLDPTKHPPLWRVWPLAEVPEIGMTDWVFSDFVHCFFHTKNAVTELCKRQTF